MDFGQSDKQTTCHRGYVPSNYSFHCGFIGPSPLTANWLSAPTFQQSQLMHLLLRVSISVTILILSCQLLSIFRLSFFTLQEVQNMFCHQRNPSYSYQYQQQMSKIVQVGQFALRSTLTLLGLRYWETFSSRTSTQFTISAITSSRLLLLIVLLYYTPLATTRKIYI